MASLINVRLNRGDASPWGFRLQGGKDFGTPLVIQKVNGNSLAEKAGLQVGDAVIKVNGHEVFNLRHKDAQDIIVRSGNNIEVTIQRGGSTTWKPSVQAVGGGVTPSTRLPTNVAPVTKTSLAASKPSGPSNIGSSHNYSPRPFSQVNGEPVKSIVNKQYNSPVNMYSEETIAETLSAQAEVLAGGVLGVNFKKNERGYDAEKSEVYKMLLEAEREPKTPEPDVRASTAYFSHASHATGGRAVSPRPMTPIAQQMNMPTQTKEPPYMPGSGTETSTTDSPRCYGCNTTIVGIFVRIKDKNLHVECFKCATCGSSLKNVGYYSINNKLYCDVHAKLVARQNPPAPNLDPISVPSPSSGIPAPPSAAPQSPQSNLGPLPFHSPRVAPSHVAAPRPVPKSSPSANTGIKPFSSMQPRSAPYQPPAAPYQPPAAPYQPPPAPSAPVTAPTPAAPFYNKPQSDESNKYFRPPNQEDGSNTTPAATTIPVYIPTPPSQQSSNDGAGANVSGVTPIEDIPCCLNKNKRMSICSEEVCKLSEEEKKKMVKGGCLKLMEEESGRPESPVPFTKFESDSTVTTPQQEEMKSFGLAVSNLNIEEKRDGNTLTKTLASEELRSCGVGGKSSSQTVEKSEENGVQRTRTIRTEESFSHSSSSFASVKASSTSTRCITPEICEIMEKPRGSPSLLPSSMDRPITPQQTISFPPEIPDFFMVPKSGTSTPQPHALQRILSEELGIKPIQPALPKEELFQAISLKDDSKIVKIEELFTKSQVDEIVDNELNKYKNSTNSKSLFDQESSQNLTSKQELSEQQVQEKNFKIKEQFEQQETQLEIKQQQEAQVQQQQQMLIQERQKQQQQQLQLQQQEQIQKKEKQQQQELQLQKLQFQQQQLQRQQQLQIQQQQKNHQEVQFQQQQQQLKLQQQEQIQEQQKQLQQELQLKQQQQQLQRQQQLQSQQQQINQQEVQFQQQQQQKLQQQNVQYYEEQSQQRETLKISQQQQESEIQTNKEVQSFLHQKPERSFSPVHPPSNIIRPQPKMIPLPPETKPYQPPPPPPQISEEDQRAQMAEYRKMACQSPLVAALTVAPSRPFTPTTFKPIPTLDDLPKPPAGESMSLLSALTIAPDQPYHPFPKPVDVSRISPPTFKKWQQQSISTSQQSESFKSEQVTTSVHQSQTVSYPKPLSAMESSLGPNRQQALKPVENSSAFKPLPKPQPETVSKPATQAVSVPKSFPPVSDELKACSIKPFMQSFPTKNQIDTRSISPSGSLNRPATLPYYQKNMGDVPLVNKSKSPVPHKVPMIDLTKSSACQRSSSVAGNIISSNNARSRSLIGGSSGYVSSSVYGQTFTSNKDEPAQRPKSTTFGEASDLLPYYQQNIGEIPLAHRPKSPVPHAIKAPSSSLPARASPTLNRPSPLAGKAPETLLKSKQVFKPEVKPCNNVFAACPEPLKQVFKPEVKPCNNVFAACPEPLKQVFKPEVKPCNNVLAACPEPLKPLNKTIPHFTKPKSTEESSQSKSPGVPWVMKKVEELSSSSITKNKEERTILSSFLKSSIQGPVPFPKTPQTPSTAPGSAPSSLKSAAGFSPPKPVGAPTISVPPTGAGDSSGGSGNKGATFAGSTAPRRGRGTLNPSVAPGARVPLCGSCNSQIRGPFITALGKIWCPDHFVCANAQCKRPLQDVGFVEENAGLYCEFCFEQFLAPSCNKCDKKIKGDCLNAIGKHFHPECFCCAYCGKQFGNSPFFLEDALPYCENDWNELFTTKCFSCGFPIEAGDRWVEALANNYHSQCFNCTMCKKNLEGQSFFAKGGRPFCKTHAR